MGLLRALVIDMALPDDLNPLIFSVVFLQREAGSAHTQISTQLHLIMVTHEEPPHDGQHRRQTSYGRLRGQDDRQICPLQGKHTDG